MVVGFSSEATASSRGRFTMCRVNEERNGEKERGIVWKGLEKRGMEGDGDRNGRKEWRERRGWKGGGEPGRERRWKEGEGRRMSVVAVVAYTVV